MPMSSGSEMLAEVPVRILTGSPSSAYTLLVPGMDKEGASLAGTKRIVTTVLVESPESSVVVTLSSMERFRIAGRSWLFVSFTV